MATDFTSDPQLPTEASSTIWRIFGDGESSATQRTTYELIAPIIRSHVSPGQQDETIREIRTWFEIHGDRWWLREEKRDQVAILILDGVCEALSSTRRISCHETAFWAVGSVKADLAERIIRSSWSSEWTDAFVSYAFDTLEKLCERDLVLDAARMRYGVPNSRASMTPVDRRDVLITLRQSEAYGWWLFPGILNIVELLIRLDGSHFYTLFDRIDHVAVQIWAANCQIFLTGSHDHKEPLQWISKGSTDALIGLAIVHLLDSVNTLDGEFQRRSVLQGEKSGLDPTASALLSHLVDRLALTEPMDCMRWLIDLLDSGMSILSSHGHGGKTPRAEHLEKLCTQLFERLVCESWSDDVLTVLGAGLGSDPLTPRTHPLAEIAWDLREVQPEVTQQIAHLILDAYEEHMSETLDDSRTLFYNLGDWRDREWISSIGVALSLSGQEVDLSAWVAETCRELPLSAWDAEEDPDGFLVAGRMAQFRFLVAFDAILPLAEIGRAVDPSVVLALAEKLWTHCHFVQQYTLRQHEGTEAAEYAARVAVELGEPSDMWILDQARASYVDPRTLWSLIDQQSSKNSRERRTKTADDDEVSAELRRVASSRFRGGETSSLVKLYYIGQLWLSLDNAEEAQHTAADILALDNLGRLERTHKVLALKLLALASSELSLAPALMSEIKSLYSQLWSSSYTPSGESCDRQQIDDHLK